MNNDGASIAVTECRRCAPLSLPSRQMSYLHSRANTASLGHSVAWHRSTVYHHWLALSPSYIVIDYPTDHLDRFITSTFTYHRCPLFLSHTKKPNPTSWSGNLATRNTINSSTNVSSRWPTGKSEWSKRRAGSSFISSSWPNRDSGRVGCWAWEKSGTRRPWTIWPIPTGRNGWVICGRSGKWPWHISPSDLRTAEETRVHMSHRLLRVDRDRAVDGSYDL